MNLRKNEGFLTSIPSIPIPEYGQSNAPLVTEDSMESIRFRDVDTICYTCRRE